MKKLKHVAPYSRAAIRYVSLLNLAVPPLLLFLAGGRAMVRPVLFDIIASSSMILMIPDTFNDIKFSSGAALFTLFLLLLCNMSAVMGISQNALTWLYLPAVTSPLLACLLHRVHEMMNTPAYLTMKITGWELLLCVIKGCYIVGYYIVSLVAVSLLPAARADSPARCAAPLVLAIALYIVLYVRSMTASPIILFSSAGQPSGEKDVVSSAYLPDVSKEDYRHMYDKLCRLMEEKNPFLDANYSLDDLVRSMISNKTYVSKLIKTCTGLNFSQFVNKYRVDYAKEMFRRDTDLKVKDLAEMSGFNSQVTFIMSFKLFYEKTPGLWCKEYKDLIGRP